MAISSNGDQNRRPSLFLEILENRINPVVQFYGGNVLPQVELQPVYYGSAWTTAAQNQTYLDAYAKDIVGGSFMDSLTQAGYGVGRGTATKGVVDPVKISPGSVISDASIQASLKADIKSGLLPAPDSNRLYVVYVEPDVAVKLAGSQGSTQLGVLGYHGAFAGPGGTAIRYAVIAYPGGAARNSSMGTAPLDQLTAVASHELSEAVTDPDANYGLTGWYDPKLGEIGDVTENKPKALVRLDAYLVQLFAGKDDQMVNLVQATTPAVPDPAPAPTPAPDPNPVPVPNPQLPTAPPPARSTTTATLVAGPLILQGAGSGLSRGAIAGTTLIVTVIPSSGTVQPRGLVELIYNGRLIGVSRLRAVDGVQTTTFEVAFGAAGTFGFTAQYVGDRLFQGSGSSPVTVEVPVPVPPVLAATVVTLTAGPVVPATPPSGRYPRDRDHGFDHNVASTTLTVTVGPATANGLHPSGIVALVANGKVIATARIRLVNGIATATFSVGFQNTGSFAFAAQYLGNDQFQAAASESLTMVV